MKPCCFVILVFISVIFTVKGGEWGNEGIRGVNSLPISSINNQNEEISLTKRWHTGKILVRNPGEEGEDYKKHPNSSQNPTNQAKAINGNNKGKEDETQNAQNQNVENANNTAKKLEEEAQTINRVIVVLGSLGASLLLVAIAIAVLYWKVRRQQKLVKRDTGSGVGGGETSIGDDSEDLFTPVRSEKSIVINPNSSSGVNNGIGVGIVGDKVNNETSESQRIQIHIQQQLSPQPTAPPAEKLIEDNNDLDIDISGSNLSTPPLLAPPAYTPTAPPIYALPHTPIELYSDENTYQHNPENNNNNGGAFIRMPLPAWYAAGPTSQINIPTTIIQPATNLNSSFSSRENNDENDRSTHQRQTI
ncbi:345_t:CDS:2 [Rhizophagus irregularis]|nr:345_t:CDS:2 [Rhizophagus irregularis]